MSPNTYRVGGADLQLITQRSHSPSSSSPGSCADVSRVPRSYVTPSIHSLPTHMRRAYHVVALVVVALLVACRRPAPPPHVAPTPTDAAAIDASPDATTDATADATPDAYYPPLQVEPLNPPLILIEPSDGGL